MDASRPERWIGPALITLIGAGLRFHALALDRRFHPDEAFFSTFARAAAIKGDWLLPGLLDKPPLSLYANALAQAFIGEGEFAARVPGVIASILLIPLLYALALRLYGRGAALYAALLAALSPYLLAFSATAFTDGLMLLGLTAALVYAAFGRGGAAGVWLAIAVASKPQALFYLPMLAPMIWARGKPRRFALGLLAGVIPWLLWELARAPDGPTFALGAAYNDPGQALAAANDLLPRLGAWLAYGGYLLGPPPITAALLALALIVAAQHRRGAALFIGWVAGYALLHWLGAFNTYDRYLLPILPPLIVVSAAGLADLGRRARLSPRVGAALIGALLLPMALAAADDRAPVNTGHRDYVGIDAVAGWLRAKPVATVIYDRWLGWQLDYYLGTWSDKRRVYYPAPAPLVADALRLCEIGPRYLPAPVDAPVGPWLDALRAAGFGVAPAFRAPRFIAYQIIPPWSRPGSAITCPHDGPMPPPVGED